MIAALDALRALAGDALLAAGEVVRGGSPNVDAWARTDYLLGGFESDGPDIAKPIPRVEVRQAVDELTDSQLLNIAATVIDSLTDADVLVAALRDRAAQWAVVEADAADQFHVPAHLWGAPLTRSEQSRSE